MTYLEGLAFIEERSRSNPNCWKEIANIIHEKLYICSLEYGLFPLNHTAAVAKEIIELIRSNSKYDMNVNFMTCLMKDHEYEFAFYDKDQISESDVAARMKRRRTNK